MRNETERCNNAPTSIFQQSCNNNSGLFEIGVLSQIIGVQQKCNNPAPIFHQFVLSWIMGPDRPAPILHQSRTNPAPITAGLDLGPKVACRSPAPTPAPIFQAALGFSGCACRSPAPIPHQSCINNFEGPKNTQHQYYTNPAPKKQSAATKPRREKTTPLQQYF